MEWMLHEVRARHNTPDWSRGSTPAEAPSWSSEIVPVARTIGGPTTTGFSYRYHYRSAGIPIYKILDRRKLGTRRNRSGQRVLDAQVLRARASPGSDSEAQFYSTDDGTSLTAPTPAHSSSCLSRQSFRAFHSPHQLPESLVTWSPQVAHIRSLLRKPRSRLRDDPFS